MLDQVRRRADLLRRRHRLLPRQARRAASTGASTCSAPTTTATSAGCGRWRACAGDDPDADPRGADRPAGQAWSQDGERVRLSKRAGTHRHAGRVRRRDRRRRRRATPWPATRPTRRSTLDVDRDHQGSPTTTRSTTCSTPTPAPAALLRNAARARHRPADDASTPTLLDPPARGRPAAALGEFPRVVAGRGRAARSRTGSRATSRTLAGDLPPLVRHTAGSLPQGDERDHRRQPRPAVAERGDPGRAGQRPRPARRLRPGADVSRATPHPAGLRARRRSLPRAAPGCARRADVNALDAAALADVGAREVDGVAAASAASRSPTWSPSTARPALRPRRGRPARPGRGPTATPSPASTSTTPARRSSARRSPAGSPRRASASTSAPAASWPSRCAAGFPAERIGFHGNNKSRRRAARGPSTPGVGPDHRRLLRRDRAAGRRRRASRASAQRVLVRVTVGVEAHTHEFIATAHEDQKFGFSLRDGAALEAVAAVLGRAGARAASACTPTSARRSSTPPASRSPRTGSSGCRRRSATSTASSCPSSTSAAASASPTSTERRPRRRRRRLADRLTAIVERECARGRAAPCRGCRSSRAARSSGPARVTVYEVGTVKAVDARRRRACAPTSRSTAA